MKKSSTNYELSVSSLIFRKHYRLSHLIPHYPEQAIRILPQAHGLTSTHNQIALLSISAPETEVSHLRIDLSHYQSNARTPSYYRDNPSDAPYTDALITTFRIRKDDAPSSQSKTKPYLPPSFDQDTQSERTTPHAES